MELLEAELGRHPRAAVLGNITVLRFDSLACTLTFLVRKMLVVEKRQGWETGLSRQTRT